MVTRSTFIQIIEIEINGHLNCKNRYYDYWKVVYEDKILMKIFTLFLGKEKDE